MKKSILMISLMTVAMAVFAIDYPTYKPTTPSYSGGSSGNGTGDDDNTGTTYGGYSTTTSGGTTTYGEGSALGGQRRAGARRAPGAYNGPEPPSGVEQGSTWTDPKTEKVYILTDGKWIYNFDEVYDPGYKDSGSPIGTPWVMLLFAAAAAAVVAVRRRKAMAVVALLLVCGQGWAYTVNGNVAEWTQGETFTLVLPDGAKAYQFSNTNGMPGHTPLDTQASRSVVITLSQSSTWTYNNQVIFQWQDKNNQWNHGSMSWVKFSTSGTQTATNEFPIPDREGYTTLTITLDDSSNSVFTWSEDTPGPAPQGGDTPIDGCDGCFLVEE